MNHGLQHIVEQILCQSPGPVVRWRLLRDVLAATTDPAEIETARQALDQSRWVRELSVEQWQDGSWGAFHSRNSKRRQRILTTEFGVARALALGLEPDHPVLFGVQRYLLHLLYGEIPFPDRNEVNDRWPTGVRLFMAATLSLIQPAHPILDKDRSLWLAIARRAFRSGVYREVDEIAAHQELTGASVKGSYLTLRGKYQLSLLGSLPGLLPVELEQALLQWLWANPVGIGYLGVPLNPPPNGRPEVIDRWLASHELLAPRFTCWTSVARPAIDWLWEQRNPQGFWDFGPLPRESACLPFSDSWRDLRSRQLDWTVRVLILLNQACL